MIKIINTHYQIRYGYNLCQTISLLRGDFKQSQYGRIILPFTLLRRLECVLEATKPNDLV